MEALSREELHDLAKQLDPTVELDDDVTNVLFDLADEFVEEVMSASCQLAKHRQSDKVEGKDIKFCLEKNWDIRVPGYLSPQEGAPKSRPAASDAHKANAEKVRREQW